MGSFINVPELALHLGRTFVNRTLPDIWNPWNHSDVVKEITFIPTLSFFLGHEEEFLAAKSMEILYLLAQNPNTVVLLKNNDYLLNALEMAFRSYEGSVNLKRLYSMARETRRKMRDSTYEMKIVDGVELRDKEDEDLWAETTIMFEVDDLDKDNEDNIRKLFTRIPGIHSVAINVRRRIVTVDVGMYFSTSMACSALWSSLLIKMKTVHTWEYILWNVYQEADLDAPEENWDISLPEYPDFDEPVLDNAVATIKVVKKKTRSIFTWIHENLFG